MVSLSSDGSTTLDSTPAEPSQDSRRWWGLATLALGLSLIVLDGTIVGVATPTIITALDLDLSSAEWISSLYNVIFAALLLPFGRLGDAKGRRTLFIIGIAVFITGSVLASQASTGSLLIGARAIQGVGGAMVLPTTLSTVSATFRGRDRAVAFGVWGAVMSGAAALGPLLGGWFTTSFDWTWIFLINVPLGLLTIVGAFAFVPKTGGEASVQRGADPLGTLISIPAAGLLVFGLIEGRSYGWWTPSSQMVIGPLTWGTDAPLSPASVALGVGAVLMICFIVVERHRVKRNVATTLDTSLFAIPTFAWGNLTATVVAAGEFSLVFVLPLYLQNALGLSAMDAGWVLAAMALGAFFSGASARHLAARMGAAQVVVLGLGLEVLGVAGTAAMTRTSVTPVWLTLALVIYGLGLGLASAQLTSTVLAEVPVEKSGTGSATQSTMRQIGSALGTALAGTMLGSRLSSVLPGLLAQIGSLPDQVASGLVDATANSAGSSIAGLREQGTSGQLGELGPQVTQLLSDGFAQAARDSLMLTAALLVLGLIGALRVLHVARASGSASARPTRAASSATSR